MIPEFELDELRIAAEARIRHQSVRITSPSVTLSAYVERIKNISLDLWQIDLCDRLEKAFWLARADEFAFFEDEHWLFSPSGFKISKDEFNQKKGKGTRAAIHAAPQFGKSIIISQAYPAWILGYDPLHRFRLATYNVFHSARFSVVIKNILLSPEQRAIFPDPAGHIPERSKAVEWSTNARLQLNDGQASFTALGLQSGFTGTGAETLLMDDPYKSVEEALSEVIRDKTWRFHTDTASPRLGEHSNEFIMFHRYHQDDIGGRAIASGEFELWRYAAEADGDYVDDETGLTFPDPLGRKEGEFLSPRRSKEYYARQKANESVWCSQFQGRPTSKSGQMFNVDLLKTISEGDMPELVHIVRAWDNAATEGAGAYSAGVKIGLDSSGKVYVLDVVRRQLNTAGREALQLDIAHADGKLVSIHAPQDPASAGKDVAFLFEQLMSRAGFMAATTPVTGTKEMRAYGLSLAVNRGDASMVEGEWNKSFRNELMNFPVGTYKDQVDAASDGYNLLSKLFHRGLVIKGYRPEVHLVGRQRFATRFGEKIPKHWDVSAAVRLEADSSRPSGWAIVARAAENAQLGETVFVVAASRQTVRDPALILAEVKNSLVRFCEGGFEQARAIWLSQESEAHARVALDKMGLYANIWDRDTSAGLPETNWYFQVQNSKQHPFYQRLGASRIYLLVDDEQLDNPRDAEGLLHTRQELVGWAYNEKDEPQSYGGVTLDCVRRLLYDFALRATPYTTDERQEQKLPEHLRKEQVFAKIGQRDFAEAFMARELAQNQIKMREKKEKKDLQRKLGRFMPRFPQHNKYRPR